jgi:hypothetical protein
VSSPTQTLSLGDAAKALGVVLGESAKLGVGLLDSIKLPLPRRVCCDCEIPPPCWEPQPIGDVTTRACPGNKATLRVHVRNCGSSPRTVTVEAVDKTVSASPASVTIGPYEEATVVLARDVPGDAGEGERWTSVVWVRGCRVHYLRWTVQVAAACTSCCDEVEVDDCPDLVHHWYDHFYCERPCPHQG